MIKTLLLQFSFIPILRRGAYLMGVLVLLCVSELQAQDVRTVTGKVTSSEENEALPGVNVLIEGTTKGTVTGVDGTYSIQVSNNDVLVFSFVGFVTKQLPVGNMTTMDVKLELDITSLDEVVVLGYGKQLKSDVTSSVAAVKDDEFIKGNVVDAGQLIQGKVAGLTVSMPSGDPTSGTQILLRGQSTILGTNVSPLILIDGIPGDFKTVPPEDIASISVLKDGSAAAIYGTRGTNGVILITTKRASGSLNGLDYSVSFSTQQITRKPELLTAGDYQAQIAAGDRAAQWDLGSSTDWLDEITQTPFSHVHNLTYRGGNTTTNYLANINYRDLEGIFLKSDNQTFTGRIDINHAMFNDKLKFNLGLLSSANNFTSTGDGASFNGYTYRQALLYNPTSPIYNDDGYYYEQTGLFNYENPLGRIYESDGEHRSQNVRYTASVSYLPVTGLELKSNFSVNRYNQTRGYAESKHHISTLRDGRNGFVSNGTRETQDRLMELTANYSTVFGNHNISVLAGYSYQDFYYRDYWMQNWDFPTDIFSYHNIDQGQAIREGEVNVPIDGFTSKTNLIGFFGRVTYSYEDKYLFMASLRHEAASQLVGTEDPWGTFPAVSVGWKISNESFLSGSNIVELLKLRAGYGVTGSQNSAPFGAVALLSYNNFYYFNGSWVPTLSPSQNFNPYLQWEEKKEQNYGIDFSLLKGRVYGSVDYYIRNIDNLLYDFAVPSPPNLYNTTRANVGVMENKGLEVLVNIVPIKTPDFEWTTSLNFSTNQNSLKSLSNDLYEATNDWFVTGATGEPIQTYTHRVEVGEDIGNFYGFKVVDVGEDGLWIYENAEGERVAYADFTHAEEDKQVLGNGLPNYYAGWNNTFRYKNIDLSITMRGAFDYQILNFQRMYYENPTIQNYNRLASSTDPVFGKAALTAPLEYNSYYIEDGDFWKIDNITLGYNIPAIGNNFIKRARIYASALNAFVFTGYSGIDPEVNRLGLDPGNDGRDKYPTSRTYTVGFNISF
ncbi:SusC/RagA family TonB-linked outer membrane protein [Fulvivirga ligni]|uniref:SusC/RagA family TonB-linked outer membrane protein n=1 Tax=Fulvivirga ligni TaxID=2904246 RepID=UPI001F256045|nr:SusC/RagA family TonB-linked outer membrane protein [Fulvivirga ligni]UII23433.1 SusC/RagA family TonB-linked outer membrane protein [Fulvivirga ligni]